MVHSARVVALPNPKVTPPAQQAALHPLAPKPVSVLSSTVRIGTGIVTQLAAPVLTIAFLLVLWQMLASSPTSALPSPLKVIDESWEIIVYPFKVGNGIDQGLFWHVTASLVRVGYGYTLAAFLGIGLGVLLGQSTLAMRGLDPVF